MSIFSIIFFSIRLIREHISDMRRDVSAKMFTVWFFLCVKMLDFRVASDFDRGRIESKKLDFLVGPMSPPIPAPMSSTEVLWLRSLWGVELRFRIVLWMVLIVEGCVTEKRKFSE